MYLQVDTSNHRIFLFLFSKIVNRSVSCDNILKNLGAPIPNLNLKKKTTSGKESLYSHRCKFQSSTEIRCNLFNFLTVLFVKYLDFFYLSNFCPGFPVIVLFYFFCS